MTYNDFEMLFKFIGGLGFFLYGMNMMADGLQKSAGNKMKKLLGFLTNNRLVAVLLGTAVTAIIQSSSATTVMVVGFVNAGLMNLTQAVGVIMGANIGTTVTAWIVSMNELGSIFKPEFSAPLIVGIGAFLILFANREKKRDVGEILVGFGTLFIGLSFMSAAIVPYRDAPIFSQAFRVLGEYPILAILAGTVVTGIIQSSSASVGILQTLAMNDMVTWKAAIFITLGQNIGTCVTALLSAIGTGKNAKRAAAIHLLFNVIGAVVAGVVMFVVFAVWKTFAASLISSVEISIFHTIFNICNTLILFPFANQLVKLSKVLVRGTDEEEDEDESVMVARRLDERILETPSFALESVAREVVNMGNLAVNHLSIAMDALLTRSSKRVKKVRNMEETMDKLALLITDYLVKVSSLSLTEQQHLLVNDLLNTVNDIERIGDHCDNIGELAEKYIKEEVEFSEKAIKGLKKIYAKTIEGAENAVKAREMLDVAAVELTVTNEQIVDILEEELRKDHMKRLAKKQCTAATGVIYLDVLTNLERISDHAMNIAGYVLEENTAS
ncbi:MAG TPA: Na/Pi cotransporter family protein [Lachnospiraceae bacterium]|nr:Na/Pi cotransporter family protein [Lachnospiraceae bacterium]